jgi:hypothetical protein
MDALRHIAENKIIAAIQNGDFADISGKGKPLLLEWQQSENDESFLANHLLRNNGFLPDWLAERKQLLEEIQSLQAQNPGHGFPADDTHETILQLNRRISGYNLRVPVDAMQLQLLPIR